MRHEPTMKNPASKEKTMELHDDFMKYVTGEKEIPEKFLRKILIDDLQIVQRFTNCMRNTKRAHTYRPCDGCSYDNLYPACTTQVTY